MTNFASAKKIMDFYMKKLEEDKESTEAPFTLQMAQLKLLLYSTSCMLDALESYEIETDL